MTLRLRLNPRLYLAAAMGWAVFAVVTLAALIAAHLAAEQAELRARSDAESLLAEFATQVRDTLSMHLETRRALLQATATQIAASEDRSARTLSRALGALQAQYPEYSWLGIASGAGRMIVDTDRIPPGTDVSQVPWFHESSAQPYVSDARPQSRDVAATLAAGAGLSGRSIDMSIPLDPSLGPAGGVIAAEVSWSWVELVVARMQTAFTRHRELEVILAARDGSVLLGPQAWLGRAITSDSDIAEGGAYLAGSRAQLRLAQGLGLGWTAVVRQRADLALAPVRTTRRTVFSIVFLAGLMAAAVAVQATGLLTRRLTALAAEAEAVQRGQQRRLLPPPGADEVSRIGATLAQVVDFLQSEKQALQTLNAELDLRVIERTQRIERLAKEARHAAVTRERLRMARDLHDTLAHSLMALLTQIRMIRKFRARMETTTLETELAQAEAVAATGLTEARAAIKQMRDNGVRDAGLGPALHDLARRFAQRTGVATTIETDPLSANWLDERAETVFRIVEESLRNVERHAKSRTVRVQLRRIPLSEAGVDALGQPTRALLEVADDGIGFDPLGAHPGHFGLLGMHEQAALIDAKICISSQAGQGTAVTIEFEY
ncbi:MAG: hypothetical protein IV092_14630 [Burkholderiaceae bacterium]|nr:hypothetical protein [Burkholderiaceae bacterium]